VTPIRVQLEADDYVAAQRVHTRWTRRRLGFVAAMLVAAMLFALAGMYERWLLVIASGLFCGVVGGVFASEFVRRVVLPRRSRRIFAQQKNLQRPLEFWWNDDALHGSNERGSSATPWADYLRSRRDDRVILLYLSDAMFQIVPTRCFEPAQLTEFLERVEAIGST